MRLMDTRGEQFEAIPLSGELALIRGGLGGVPPQIVTIESLLERARPLIERRQATRRFARSDRRQRRRQDERRGFTYTWLEQKGRRRADVFSIQDDREAAEALASVRTRLRIG